MTYANLLRSLQITLVTEIGDIVTTTSKQVTSSCGTVSRSDFLKKIQEREFSDFSEFFISKSSQFLENLKILTKDFGKMTRKIVFGNLFIDRFHCLQEMNDFVMMMSQ